MAENEQSLPPPAVRNTMNRIMGTVLRTPLHGVLSGSLMLIRFTGRKSGKTYTTPVGYMQDGDWLTVFTHSTWWKNFEQEPQVDVLLRGDWRSGRAHAITDHTQMMTYVDAFIERNGVENLRRAGISPAVENPSREQIEDAARGTVIIRIELDE
ncbi:MAG: nitroreductase family deazaflavin-dependent oxidoreductase [Chloroflexi bacterium]|nr:nitroreductase family deazaflavin-dependent oxidoreductase [Chloroflexota bacterium]